MNKSLEIHGISEDSLRRYLIQQGGEDLPGGSISGPSWIATITPLPDYKIGRMALCCFLVKMTGEETAVRKAWHGFELCVLRPGG